MAVATSSGVRSAFDFRNQFARIEVQHGLRFLAINVEAAADDTFVGIVLAALDFGTVLHAVNHHLFVRADQVNDADDVERSIQVLGLVNVAGNAVEGKRVVRGSNCFEVTIRAIAC